ncbi:MAG: hypothetical protein ACOX7K_09945 [Oscillospiraceae bacterium]|jgi:hypothetical protein
MNTKVSFEGIGELSATFYHDNATKGELVMLSDNHRVKDCTSGATFIGICTNANALTAQVQLYGYVKLPYTGSTAPSVGYCRLMANGDGGVSVASSSTGREYLVLDVDTTDAVVGFML